MVRALLLTFAVITLLGACTQRMICPAYQSAFIYDKDQLRKKFSYFQEDSTPKVFTASKNKYLIAEYQPYRKKIRNMATVPMKPVNPVLPDSLRAGEEGLDEDGIVPGAELDAAARSVIDSTYIVDVPRDTLAQAPEDSVYVISKDKELRLLKYNFPDSLVLDPATGKHVPQTPRYAVTDVKFNVEQDNYMWYLRDYLVLPDVRLARMKQTEGEKGEKAGTKKGKKGFFRNLFKKKKKEQPDTTAIQKQPVREEDEFDFIDKDEEKQPSATPQQEQVPASEKKGIFGRKRNAGKTSDGDSDKSKKKRDKKKQKAEEKKDEKKPEDDDGF